ncbi:MAG: molecular chaperone HtpG [Spirochaetia bacterium]|nr:molecular chaperone HtpG [Spirochaetia bacterium]
MASHQFQTEVSQLLHLIIHSLYSNKEIFLRELISNASDALDKLKYLSLTDDKYKSLDQEFRIDIKFDEEAHTLTIADTGIGMNDEELAQNLGTIAKSGTKSFLANLSGDAKKDSNLIGQFGVGFYSAYMVADKIEVLTKKPGDSQGWKWTSDGKGEFDISPAEKENYGTSITLYLNDEGKEYTTRWQLELLIKKYSDHISFPIYLEYMSVRYEGDEKDPKEIKEKKIEKINSGSALWKRSKSELTDADYNEFYKTISHDTEDPLFYVHTKAEGTLEYTTLFFIPKKAPFDMLHADYKPGVKLYVSRVFITDDDQELMPVYLRFLRGVIDSEDLPLNVSREILQQNKIMSSIRNASVKKVLAELKSLSESNKEKYNEFIKQYNVVLKEGIWSDWANRDTLLDLVRFKSTVADGYTSFADYVGRMKEGQKAIYYITGGNEQSLKASPLIEAYKAKGYEVLVMDDPRIDEIVLSALGKYKDYDLKSVNKSGSAEELKSAEDEAKADALKPVLEKIKNVLGDKIKKAVVSSRLSDSPSCIVADENDPTMEMQEILRSIGQQKDDCAPVLEINPDHVIVKRLADTDDKETVEDISWLLLDEAKLAEGAKLDDPAGFIRRINKLAEKAL